MSLRSSLLRGAGAGLVTAGLLAALPVPGPLLGVLLLLILAGVPSATLLVRRLVLNGLAVLGLIPLIWWLPWRLGRLDHAGLLIALGVAALVTAAPLVGWRSSLRPGIRLVDAAAVPAALGAAGWALWPWLTFPETAAALNRALHGWDHIAHYSITRDVCAAGVMLPMAPPGPGGPPTYAPYAQGFHATAATVLEVLRGPQSCPTSPYVDLSVITRAESLVVVLAAGLLACAVLSVGRDRWGLLLRVATVIGVVLLGPFSLPALMQYGYPNFAFTVLVIGTLPAVLVLWRRPGQPAPTLAVAGVLGTAAHGWVLLGPFVGVPVLVHLAGLIRRRPAGSRRRPPLWWWLTLALAALSGALALWQVLQISPGAIVTAGGFPIYPVALSTLPVVAAVLLPLGGMRLLRRGPRRRLAGVPAAAAVSAMATTAAVTGLGLNLFLQSELGRPGYYFLKLWVGAVLLAVCALVTLAGVAASRGHRRRAAALCCLVLVWAVAMTQSDPAERHPMPTAIGARVTVAALPPPRIVARDARLLDGALAVSRADDGLRAIIADNDSPAGHILFVNHWWHSLTGRVGLDQRRVDAAQWIETDSTPGHEPATLEERVTRIIDAGGTVLVVPPAWRDRVQAIVDQRRPGHGIRVRVW